MRRQLATQLQAPQGGSALDVEALRVPAQADYTLDITPQYGGYQPRAVPISVGTGDLARTLRLSVNALRCTAAGYRPTHTGVRESFDSGTKPPGWTVLRRKPG